MFERILERYDISTAANIQPFGSGLINSTWKISDGPKDYILQKINNDVFKNPWLIAANIETISGYLRDNHPAYFFVSPLKTAPGENMVFIEESGYYRLFPFVENSITLQVAKTPASAFEAARQFALFTKNLSGLPIATLRTTLPDFHNLKFRYEEFLKAVKSGNAERINKSKSLIDFLISHSHIVGTYEKITASEQFKKRVTHHDTKISNILFDENGKALCVIDLDTVMPGYFISDIGDMLRTYVSPVSEEEKDFSKIEVREDYFRGIVDGYMSEMAGELTKEEKQHFVYAGFFLVYMQALRFLADYLNNDRYYGSAYEGQNFIRATNQVVLLKHFIGKQEVLGKIVEEVIKS